MNINIGDGYITGVHNNCQYTIKSVKHDCDFFTRTYFFLLNAEFIKSIRRVWVYILQIIQSTKLVRIFLETKIMLICGEHFTKEILLFG